MGLAVDSRIKAPDVGCIATGLNMKLGQLNTTLW